MRTTYGQFIADRTFVQATGVCDADDRLALTNKAQRMMNDMGEYWGTRAEIRFCVSEGCITTPREVKKVLAVDICNTVKRPVNGWYEYGEYGWGKRPCHACAPVRDIELTGTWPGYSDITGSNKTIRLYPAHASDAGKHVILQGYDANNLWIRSQVSGVWIDGEQVTLAVPYVDSTNTFKTLTSVIKDATNADVAVYEYDTVEDTERAIARWQPSETTPAYRRYNIDPWDNIGCACCCPEDDDGYRTVTALVKLEYIPVAVANDWLLLPNVDATAAMCQSILASQRGDQLNAEKFRADCARELRNELVARTGEQPSINVHLFNGAGFNRVMRGFV